VRVPLTPFFSHPTLHCSGCQAHNAVARYNFRRRMRVLEREASLETIALESGLNSSDASEISYGCIAYALYSCTGKACFWSRPCRLFIPMCCREWQDVAGHGCM
jgi:hypothetical protein